MTYDDDRPGCMRVHIADERSSLAGDLYTFAALKEAATRHGVTRGILTKRDLAWNLAQHGYLAADGTLRDGWPEAAS